MRGRRAYGCLVAKLPAVRALRTLNSFNGFQLTVPTGNSIANEQRQITPKTNKSELWFSSMTHRLIMLYNCMKFYSK